MSLSENLFIESSKSLSYFYIHIFFFFQAEDGIRDYKVTGVQTCALPIYGNIILCAGLDVDVNGAITLTRGTSIPAQSLGVTPGLYITTGFGGTGPGVAGGKIGRASCRGRV